MLAYGPSTPLDSTMRAATSSPTPRIDANPSRTSSPSFSNVASASDALICGRCTSTPCRRASATNDCGE
ncbi:Uncharacterised protein [Mycobacteroides abscessus subsp. abscessus]|nr:Uncharacterised protein [Mycobacteroides abscessus subsp. abscessus]